MLLNANSSHLMVIDVQARLLPAMAEAQQVTARGNILLAAARELDIPITITEQYPRGLGPTDAALALADDDAVMEKIAFSCLRDQAIAARLEELRQDGRHQMVICGIESHVCVLQTTLDLADAGYETFVVADAVSSRAQNSVDLALARMRDEGVSIVNTEMAVFEWLKQAGTQQFKTLSALIK